MNRRLPSPFSFLHLVGVMVVLWLTACQAHSGTPRESAYAPDRVLVGLVEPATPEVMARRLAPLGLRVLRPLMEGRVYLVGLPEGMSVPQALVLLKRQSWVRYAEPDYLRRPHGPSP